METKQEYLNRIFRTASLRGMCKSQRDFASLLGVNEKAFSSALNGNERYLTDRMIGRIKLFASANELDVENLRVPLPEPEQTPDTDGFFIPKETARMYTNMSESIRLLSETIAKMQGVTMAHPDIIRSDEKKG